MKLIQLKQIVLKTINKMHSITHFFINIIIAAVLGLTPLEIFLVGLGGVLIDIDHIFYMVFGEKIHSLKKAIKFHKREYKLMRPHFFFLHFIEIIIILMILSYFINWYLFLIFAGFLLHWIFDALKYIYFYRSIVPWIEYYSLIVYLIIEK
jgi:hypothetical protein